MISGKMLLGLAIILCSMSTVIMLIIASSSKK